MAAIGAERHLSLRERVIQFHYVRLIRASCLVERLLAPLTTDVKLCFD